MATRGANQAYVNALQFRLTPGEARPGYRTQHHLEARDSAGQAGWMEWDYRPDGSAGTISNIYTNEGARRRGVATSLWHQAHDLARQGAVNPPKHSPVRTAMGSAWVAGLSNAERGVRQSNRRSRRPGEGQMGLFDEPSALSNRQFEGVQQ